MPHSTGIGGSTRITGRRGNPPTAWLIWREMSAPRKVGAWVGGFYPTRYLQYRYNGFPAVLMGIYVGDPTVAFNYGRSERLSCGGDIPDRNFNICKRAFGYRIQNAMPAHRASLRIPSQNAAIDGRQLRFLRGTGCDVLPIDVQSSNPVAGADTGFTTGWPTTRGAEGVWA